MRRSVLVAIAVLVIVLFGATILIPSQHHMTIITADGTELRLNVEIADDDAERATGLMGRSVLPENTGMLFVYPDERPRAFWMRNTTIPLSIAFIDGDGAIISVHDLQPLNETPVRSAGPAMYALEVNQGLFEESGVAAGDRVEGLP